MINMNNVHPRRNHYRNAYLEERYKVLARMVVTTTTKATETMAKLALTPLANIPPIMDTASPYAPSISNAISPVIADTSLLQRKYGHYKLKYNRSSGTTGQRPNSH